MAQFNSSRYEIFTHRQPTRDEQSPFAPASPERTVSPVGGDRPQFGKIAAAGIGFAIAKQSSGAIIQEIADTTGNPRFVTDMNNLQRAAGVAFLISKTGLPGVAIAAGVQIVNEVIRQRSLQRERATLEYENRLRGARLTIGNVGSRNYYD
jgi:hypothetical protein